MRRNLGATSLRRRRRHGSPMDVYDTLPSPLRRWMSEAALPWSPESCRRIWVRLRAEGAPVEEVLGTLARVEAKCLERDTAAQPRIEAVGDLGRHTRGAASARLQ
ncbi:DUF6525 family protein [Roseovarius aquimarinus]|uniref:DUF6525 family protein n=1 Tax=Roseovarius aquimarinus TaxID=1229156 RepID=A0ABW7I4T7_9RHOB